MDKILVEVDCPSTSKTYDFWISKKMNLATAKEKMIEEIRMFEKNDLIFEDEKETFLYREKKESLAQESFTFEELGIQSGETLFLV